ncbi:family 43 glycosylhydrolase [Nocardioides sp. zg-1228]|uniref:family 43 glycosylhydrolase n=1 Tax=Nocardioides sp. zg-1228 TaxID=2763008 RepID=UPI0016426868|nr:family 43 glycosylhydrolase [Nocardioides sp. zg-1228]MBC2932968.1 family 43 glycosylhydrolase [Nocardioides sp. zg-1228]QSF56834.1 family 43 glycosylhydrolase [Nocardioides sp. zg-1228]
MPKRGAARLLVLLLAATLLSVVGPAASGPASAAPAEEWVPRPVLNLDFPDPAVVTTPGGLVAYATGDLVPHAWSRQPDGPWRRGPSLLTHKPSWSRAGGVWAVDVARVRGRWLLYYATPVKGMGEHGRCIGVARSRSARGPFRPVGSAPLVCPSYAGTPLAQDPLLPRDPTLPRAGVIDPSWFRDVDGTSYLLYKTDRIPSTIRIVALTRDGQSVRSGATSQELLRSEGVLENPVLTLRPEGYVLFASEGDWTRCGYRTTWRRSPALLDWSTATGGVFLDTTTTGLCGSGGADLVEGRRGGLIAFLHGWTCRGTALPCAGRGKWDHKPRQRGRRALYAARLGWADGVPQVTSWLRAR